MSTSKTIIELVRELKDTIQYKNHLILTEPSRIIGMDVTQSLPTILSAFEIAWRALNKGAEYEATWVLETDKDKPCTKALQCIQSLPIQL